MHDSAFLHLRFVVVLHCCSLSTAPGCGCSPPTQAPDTAAVGDSHPGLGRALGPCSPAALPLSCFSSEKEDVVTRCCPRVWGGNDGRHF